ncbi:MAG: DMT family transporter [Prevotellaceae bacterium]|nr:DMT family transporter [Prevotellaceae bacterium]
MTTPENIRRIFSHFIALFVVTVWGSTFVFTKILLLHGLTAAQVFILRFIIAYALMWVFFTTRKPRRLFASSLKDELLMLALGITGGSLYFLTENTALNYTATTNTSLIVCQCPLFAALLIAFFHKSERLRPVQIAGSLIAAAGVVVVVLNGHFVLHLSPLGDALALTACLCWAVYSLLIISANKRYDAVFITRKVFFYGLLSMIPYLIVYPEMPPMNILLKPEIIWNLIFLGAVASLLCFLAWNWIMKQLGAIYASNYLYLNPVVTILFAWALLSEQITFYFLIGTALILIGMFLADRKIPKSDRAQP